MSRRFGRNQRRRAREALAQAGHALLLEKEGRIMAEAVARESSARARTLKELLEDFASRVGRYAIAEGVPAKFASDWLGRRSNFRLPVMPDVDASAMLSNASMYDTMTICDEVMRVLDVEVVRDHMKRDMHVRLYFDEHRVGYALSDHAVRNMTRAELVGRIAPEIATFLVDLLKKEKA
jgi:hypothetical protein